MHRLVLATLAALAAALALPPAALADPPLRELLPPAEDVVIDDCGFPVLVHVVHDRFTATSFENESTLVFMLTGTALVEVVGPGGSVLLNVSGPNLVRVFPDGSLTSTGNGPWLFWGHDLEGLPPVFYTTGHFVFTLDPEGNVTFERTGRLRDVCALVGP